MKLPDLKHATILKEGPRRLFIGAYGFEDRALGWIQIQKNLNILSSAIMIRYKHSKGINKVMCLRDRLFHFGANKIEEVEYNVRMPYNLENDVEEKFNKKFDGIDEILIDISAMTKLLILICLCKLKNFAGVVRLIYSEADKYAPTVEEYNEFKQNIEVIAKFPSRGFSSIIRMKCLSSIRMQGQPVTLVAFTSFNEQLVRHMLGSISPHRLIFINGKYERSDYSWRDLATQDIHNKLIKEYHVDNPLDSNGLLRRSVSALDYRESFREINQIYKQYGNYERIICASTGDKMQTVGLFFAKAKQPDIHVEYPAPDSHFFKGFSIGIRQQHEIVFKSFSKIIENINKIN